MCGCEDIPYQGAKNGTSKVVGFGKFWVRYRKCSCWVSRSRFFFFFLRLLLLGVLKKLRL